MALSGAEGVGTGSQLPPKQVCQKHPDLKTNTGTLYHIGFNPDFRRNFSSI